MKARLLVFVSLLLCGAAFASDPAVWNRPTTDITVGTAAYFDCQTPSTFSGTAAYMKLWVGGQAVALNHNLNRLAAVIPIPANGAGTYPAVCQYSIDGISGINSAQLNITYGNSTAEVTKLENVTWSATSGCSGSCGPIPNPQNVFDTDPNNTFNGNDGSRYFEGTKDGAFSFEDEDWFKKRFENVALPDAWVFDFWVRQTDVPRGLEFGISQCAANNVKYRMAFQANYANTPNPAWRYFIPNPADTNGSAGAWSSPTSLQPPNFTGVSTDPNHGFTHVYFAGHPSTGVVNGMSGQPVVVVDAIQIGEANGIKGSENSASILNAQVPAYPNATGNGCPNTSGVWDLQSAQIDLDSTHTHDQMWLDEVAIRFQP